MRSISTAQSKVYATGSWHAKCRVKIQDADGNLQDMTAYKGRNWLQRVEWGETVDDRGMVANITLNMAEYHDTLAPLVQGARTNLDGGGNYGPLLDLRRDVVIETAVVALGTQPASGDWIEAFRGQIDRIRWPGTEIELECRDQAADLIDRYIETTATYGGTTGSPQDVEDAMQDILDDVFGKGVVSLYTPSTPGWAVAEFQSQHQSVMDQISLLADMIGWSVRYKWDNGTSAFRLTFYEVDRTKTAADYTFGPSDYTDVSSLDLDLSRIRNACVVTYQTGSATASVTATDATSIADYGRRAIIISEDASKGIDTSTEAQAMADACVADLKDPIARQSVTLTNYWHAAELGDLYEFEANGYHYDTDLELAVIGYRHVFSEDDVYTEITSEGAAPKAAVRKWFQKASIGGVNDLTKTTAADVPTPTVSSTPGGLVVENDALRAALAGSALTFEIHTGTTAGFTPSSSTLAATTADTRVVLPFDAEHIPVDETTYVKVIAVDTSGNKSAATAAASGVAQTLGSAVLSADFPSTAFLGGDFATQTRGQAYPPDFWDMTTGTWGVDVLLDQ